MLGRRIGLVFCGILFAASGAAGVVNGPDQLREPASVSRWLGAVELLYGVTGFAALWGLLHPGRWMWPVLGTWAAAVVAGAAIATLAYAAPGARWLTTVTSVVAATVFVGAVVGYMRRALAPPAGSESEPPC